MWKGREGDASWAVDGSHTTGPGGHGLEGTLRQNTRTVIIQQYDQSGRRIPGAQISIILLLLLLLLLIIIIIK
jgi:hypothetical protein